MRALLLCEVTLADAGGWISGSLWGAATKSAGALQAALDAAPAGKWPAVEVENVIWRVVGYLHGDVHIFGSWQGVRRPRSLWYLKMPLNP